MTWLRESDIDLTGSGWIALEGLPTGDTAGDLYEFSAYLREADVANILRLGDGVMIRGKYVPAWQVFVPPVYRDAWEATVAEFLQRARTRKTLPNTGVRGRALAELFASHVRNTK